MQYKVILSYLEYNTLWSTDLWKGTETLYLKVGFSKTV